MADSEEVKTTTSPHPAVEHKEAEAAEDVKIEEDMNDAEVADTALSHDGAKDLPDGQPPSAPAPAPKAVEKIAQPEELEARIPAKKDATLREFLSKMDDYAPIVCPRQSCAPSVSLLTNHLLDPRRSNEPLPHTGRPTASASNIATPRAPPRSCNTKVHRRRRS